MQRLIYLRHTDSTLFTRNYASKINNRSKKSFKIKNYPQPKVKNIKTKFPVNGYRTMTISAATMFTIYGSYNDFAHLKYSLSATDIFLNVIFDIAYYGAVGSFLGIIWPLSVPCFLYDKYHKIIPIK